MSVEYAQVAPGIYIGSVQAVINDEFMRGADINLVVNGSNLAVKNNTQTPTIEVVDLLDTADFSREAVEKLRFKINAVVDAARDYIKTHNAPNILFHCYAGINRSATLLAVYLVKYHGYRPADAIAALVAANKTRGLPVLTNPLFLALINDMAPYSTF
jgi:protein-tyrosine phosphatase